MNSALFRGFQLLSPISTRHQAEFANSNPDHEFQPKTRITSRLAPRVLGDVGRGVVMRSCGGIWPSRDTAHARVLSNWPSTTRSDEWPAWFFFFGFMGAGGRLPKARRGRVYYAIHHHRVLSNHKTSAFDGRRSARAVMMMVN